MDIKTPYELAGEGPYHPFRDHDTLYGWGICHEATGRVFALVGAKTEAYACACLLNGHPEAAVKFLKGTPGPIPDDYFMRFPKLGERNRQQEIVEHSADIHIRVAGQTVSLHDLAKHNPGAAFAEAFRLAGIPAPRVDTVAEAGNAPAPPRPMEEIEALIKLINISLMTLYEKADRTQTPRPPTTITLAVLETLQWIMGETTPHLQEIIDTHTAIARQARSHLQ